MMVWSTTQDTPCPTPGHDLRDRGVGSEAFDPGGGHWEGRVRKTPVLAAAVLCLTLFGFVLPGLTWVGPGQLQAQWAEADTLQNYLDDLALKRELPGRLIVAGCPESALRQADQDRERSPTPAEQASSRGLVDEAGRASILGDASRARELLQEAAALDPGSADILFRLGRLEATSGDPEEAVALLCRSLHLSPDGSDSAAAWDLLEELVPELTSPPPPAAEAAFAAGVAAWDAGSWDQAIQEFSRALVEYPGWAPAHFNRGLAYLRSGRIGAGTSDFEEYLSLEPNAEDRREIDDLLATLSSRVAAMESEDPTMASPGPTQPSGPSAGTAFLSGLVFPGMGHVYSGRPGVGVLVLASAGGAAAAGFFTRRVEVRCLALPVDGACPPGQEASRRTSRPYLFHGAAAAGAVTFVGALHAAFTARRSSRGSDVPQVISGPGNGLPLRPFGPLEVDGAGIGLELPDVALPGQLPVRTRLRLEF